MKRLILALLLLPSVSIADTNIFTVGKSQGYGTTMFDDVILCGENFNATTGYIGPGAPRYLGGVTDLTMAGAACNLLDSIDEGTADAPIAANFPAFRVHGMYCRLSSDPTADVVVTARSALADLSGTFTCTIAGTGTATSCRTTNTSTSEVATGATIAVKVVTLEDLALQDVWCKLFISVK